MLVAFRRINPYNVDGDLKKIPNYDEEKIQNIVNHCLENPLDFARYKDVVLKLRASLGMIELV